MMYDREPGDPEIDIPALLAGIDEVRSAVAKAAPGLRKDHHNYVRVSAIEQLVDRALGYARNMK